MERKINELQELKYNKEMNEGWVVKAPKIYKLNTDNIKTLKDVILVLKSCNLHITDSNEHFEELKSKGLIKYFENGK